MSEFMQDDGFRSMDTAPRDGTFVEVRSALRGNRAAFRAAYTYPYGLVIKCWVPVRGQRCGGMP